MAKKTNDASKRERIEFRVIVLFATVVLTTAYIAAGAFLMDRAGNQSASLEVRHMPQQQAYTIR